MDCRRIKGHYSFAFALALAFTPAAFAQTTNTDNSSTSQPTTASASTTTNQSGKKMKVLGTVTKRDADTITVRDTSGADTIVALNDKTSVKTKGGFLHGGKNYAVTNIVRGLILEVEGRTDSSGQLVADKIRFNDSDLRVAQTVESRVNPVESRVGNAENKISQVEENAQRLSGQIDELAAVSNAARGGAVAAQQTAEAAVNGVNLTNDRISALDEFEPQQIIAVNFKTGSAVLTPDDKAKLDDIATKAQSAKGFMIEVTGYTDSTGNVNQNRVLSQRRADAVVRYLVEDHQVPLRRIITPFGYGESNAVADNHSREGRAQNRRVEVKMLVNKGLLQTAPDMTPKTVSSNQQ